MTIPILELETQYRSIRSEIDSAITDVLTSGWFVLGKQVAAFEEEFAAFCGARYAVAVGSGTEALHLSLAAVGVTSDSEVITAANTAVPTVMGIAASGARIVLVDVDPINGLMDGNSIMSVISSKTRAVVPVHLYGHPVDPMPLLNVVRKLGIAVVEDAAQAHGASCRGQRIGTHGTAVCFSFYPSKNLGAYGDGGAVTVQDEGLRDQLLRLRNYGQTRRDHHVTYGFNSRLDELQAAVLRVKLRHLEQWNRRRKEIAEFYLDSIRHPLLSLPHTQPGAEPAWHLFVIRTEAREQLREYLAGRGIGTQVHYPVPIHLQPACSELGYRRGSFPVSEAWARTVLSLPLYPELTDEQAACVVQALNEWPGPPSASALISSPEARSPVVTS